MDNTEEQNQIEFEPNKNSPEELSKSDAITGVITSPSETYETIALTPKKNYWIIPTLIYLLVSLIVTFLILRDEQIMTNTMDKQKAQVEKSMQERVEKGKMTQEQSKQAIEQAEKFMNPKSLFFQIIGYGSSATIPFMILFILSIVYLLILKMLKANSDFSSILNVVGLAMIINVIGSIITLVLSIVMGDISTLSLGLVIKESMVGLKMYELLNKIDLITIWFYIVIAIGLAKTAKISSAKAFASVFGVWVLWLLLTSSIGMIFG